MNLAETLRRAADEEQLLLHPFPAHALSAKDEHVRQHYAQVLTVILSAQEAVSASQSRLLLLLLNSLGLGDQRAALFAQVRDWEQAQLSESLRLLREENAARAMMVDALVLLRLDAPLSEPMSGLIADMATFLGFDHSTLTELADSAAFVLGVEAEGGIIAENWPARYPRRLTAELLADGVSGGLWLVDQPLSINMPWSAHDAILVFRNGASIQTTWSGREEFSLTDCQCVNAVLTYTGAGTLTVTNCDFSGTYDASPQASAVECTGTDLVVRKSNFATTNARALACNQAALTVTESRFQACGSPEVNGGAILHVQENDALRWVWRDDIYSQTITDSHFDSCIAQRGGAIYGTYLQNIQCCEFVTCESQGFEQVDGGDIAVYCRGQVRGNPAVSECTFWNNSMYIGDAYYGHNNQFVVKSIFHHGNIYYHNKYSTNSSNSNCTFTGGSAIEKKFD